MSETAVRQVRLSEVCRQIVPDSRSICTEGSVAEVGALLPDEKRSSLSRAQSSLSLLQILAVRLTAQQS